MTEKVYGPGNRACKKCGRFGYLCRCGGEKKLAGGVTEGGRKIKWEYACGHYLVMQEMLDGSWFIIEMSQDTARRLAKFILYESGPSQSIYEEHWADKYYKE